MASTAKSLKFISQVFCIFSLIALLQIGWIGELLISFAPYAAIAGVVLSVMSIALWHRATLEFRIVSVSILFVSMLFGISSFSYFYTDSVNINYANTGLALGSVNKLVTNDNYADLRSAIRDLDIVGILEVSTEDFERIKSGWEYSYLTTCECDAAQASEIAILSKYPIENPQEYSFGLGHGGMALVDVRLGKDTKVEILAAHPKAPITSNDLIARNQQLEVIAKIATDLDHPAVIMGDFNTSPWSKNYKKFSRSIADNKYKNIKNQGAYKTWCLGEAPVFCSTIDYMFASEDVEVGSFDIESVNGSDHDLLRANVRIGSD